MRTMFAYTTSLNLQRRAGLRRPILVLTYLAGGMNLQESEMTRPPMGAHTGILIPWGNTGWAQHVIARSYQPEDYLNGVGPRPGPRTQRQTYWATWDGEKYPVFDPDPDKLFENMRLGKLFPTYTSDSREVSVERIDELTFGLTFTRKNQPPAVGDSSTIVFSEDGTRMTQIRNEGVSASGGLLPRDVRVYDRIAPEGWPVGVIPSQ